MLLSVRRVKLTVVFTFSPGLRIRSVLQFNGSKIVPFFKYKTILLLYFIDKRKRFVFQSTDTVLFNTTPSAVDGFNGLIFEDMYLEISTVLPQNPNIYGLGNILIFEFICFL